MIKKPTVYWPMIFYVAASLWADRFNDPKAFMILMPVGILLGALLEWRREKKKI
jgi:hypothetical protein